MDIVAVMAFDLIKKIDDEFKQFTGSRHAFACTVLQHYGVKVDFVNTDAGVAVTVDYDDIIRLFEPYRPIPPLGGQRLGPDCWQ